MKYTYIMVYLGTVIYRELTSKYILPLLRARVTKSMPFNETPSSQVSSH